MKFIIVAKHNIVQITPTILAIISAVSLDRLLLRSLQFRRVPHPNDGVRMGSVVKGLLRALENRVIVYKGVMENPSF